METTEVAGAPSGGAEGTAAESAASRTEGTAAPTDDQILDNAFAEGEGDGHGDESAADPGPAGDGETGGEGEGQGEGEGAEAKAEGAEGDADGKPLGEVVEPEELKPIFKMPGVGPKVRDLFYRHEAYREVFPTVAEARQLRELHPTLDDARDAAQARQELEGFDELYYSEDPQHHRDFFKKLHENDPQQFQRIAAALPDVLHEVAPEAYKADTRNRVLDVLENLAAAAQAEGGDRGTNLRNALDHVAMRLFGKTAEQALAGRNTAPDPREQALSEREQRLREQEQKSEQEAFQGFYRETNQAAVDAVTGLIKSTVDNLLKDPKTPITEKGRERITREIYQALESNLKGDREFKAQLRRALMQGGKRDQTHREQVVNLTKNRARLRLPAIAKKVVTEWTQEVLTTQGKRIQTQRAQAERRDLTGATGGRTPQAGRIPAPGQIDYNKVTDDDILDAALTGDSSRVAVRR